MKIWRPEFNSHVSNNVELFIDSHVRASGFTAANKAQYIDSKTYMPFDILTKVDVASMMHSLEVRPPFIDVKLWELAAAIPEEVNINHQNFQWSGKHLLKSILLKYYPSDFVHRKKMGFAIPLHKWFSNPIQLESMLQERIYDSNSPLSKYFQANELRSLMVERKNNPVWMFLFLDEWLRQFNSK